MTLFSFLKRVRSGELAIAHPKVKPRVTRSVTKSVRWVDATVSDSMSVAASGELDIIVGGDERTFRAFEPVFAAVGVWVSRLAGGLGTPRIAGEAVCRVPTAPSACNRLQLTFGEFAARFRTAGRQDEVDGPRCLLDSAYVDPLWQLRA